jgi:hypothetical protein
MINGAHIVIYSKDAEAGVACPEPTMQGWGRLTRIKLPGGGEIGLYQPRHERP